jgi:hypothetical protein
MQDFNFSPRHKYPVIGIAGAARSGKDTLCSGLIRIFNKISIPATRKSLAGDQIKSDLKELLLSKCNIDPFTKDSREKELIRPILVEYGKLQRAKTQGRYFINFFEASDSKVLIIPDIRFSEHPKDEIYWLKKELNGLLIFIERENVFDANETEKSNNLIIKNSADFVLKWDTLNENNEFDVKLIDNIAKNIIKNYYMPLLNNSYHLPTGQFELFR